MHGLRRRDARNLRFSTESLGARRRRHVFLPPLPAVVLCDLQELLFYAVLSRAAKTQVRRVDGRDCGACRVCVGA